MLAWTACVKTIRCSERFGRMTVIADLLRCAPYRRSDVRNHEFLESSYPGDINYAPNMYLVHSYSENMARLLPEKVDSVRKIWLMQFCRILQSRFNQGTGYSSTVFLNSASILNESVSTRLQIIWIVRLCPYRTDRTGCSKSIAWATLTHGAQSMLIVVRHERTFLLAVILSALTRLPSALTTSWQQLCDSAFQKVDSQTVRSRCFTVK